MSAVRQATSMESENRTAFLAQLGASLTQLGAIANSSALSAANKARLEPLRTEAAAWLTAIGSASHPRAPSPAASSTAVSAASAPDSGAAAAAAAAGASPPPAPSDEAASSTASAAAAAPGASPAEDSPPPRQLELASQVGDRSVAELATLLQLVFAAGIPESNKLRMIGKGVARLVAVRCGSVITAAMGHVLRATHEQAAPDAPAASPELFVGLARDIRVSTRALLLCLETVIFSADLADAASARFAVQLAVDVLRQVRGSAAFFASRLERAEAALAVAALSGASPPPASEKDDEDSCEAHAARRAAALRELWGPALTASLADTCSVLTPIVSFLVKAASPPSALAADAQTDLFAFSEASGSHGDHGEAGESPSPTGSGSPDFPTAGSSSQLADARQHSAQSASTPVSEGGGAAAAVARAAARDVLPRLQFSFFASYLCAALESCGDESEGQLVATRIVADSMTLLSQRRPRLLRAMLLADRWRRSLFLGILNCVSSLYPAVLVAGLDAQHAVAMTCCELLGYEGGTIYANCVFRLLESDNSPLYVKKEILRHLTKTFLCVRPPGGRPGPPPLLRLYQLYDLNVHAHSLNLVQQLFAALSRIVRRAAPGDFTAPEGADPGAGETSARTGAVVPEHHTLPSLALSALVLAVALLDVMSPTDDSEEERTVAGLPPLTERERKGEEQRLVDRFNSDPKKAAAHIFGVTAEDMKPEGSEEFLATCAYADLPEPADDAARAKVAAVADFMLSLPSLGPEAVAEYLTTPGVFALQVCREVMTRLDLRGKGLIAALNELLSTVQLPKEGQRIERLLEYFCGAYYAANRGPGIDPAVFPFANADACFVVVVATVMLNTNLHNPLAGMRLTQTSFRSQLRGCNDGGNFDDFFVDEIFLHISSHPLENVRSLNAASLAGGTFNTTAVEQPSRGFDALFISNEERRQLAFGAERQRIVSETQGWLGRRSGRDGGGFSRSYAEIWARRGDRRWRCASARDLFLGSWGSLCAVFGPAMYENPATPREVLVKCVRGLQSLMCVAAAFALPTECEAMLLALLSMCACAPVRDMCRNAVLTVASTSYAAHFSVRCWLSVFSLMVALRRESSGLLQSAESALSRVEILNRTACAAAPPPRAGAADAADAGGSGSGGDGDGDSGDAPETPYDRVVQGVLKLLAQCPPKDGLGLSDALYYLRRVLCYSRIRGGGVEHHLNTAALARRVMPRLVEVAGLHKESEEALQVLTEFVVELLGLLWQSRQQRLQRGEAEAAEAAAAAEDGAAPPPPPPPPVADTEDLIACFSFFRTCCLAYPRAFTLQMHLLHAVKDVVARMLRTPCAPRDTSTLFAAWRLAVFPVVRALAQNTLMSEASSLAVLVVRRLVALCNAGGGDTSNGVGGGPGSVGSSAARAVLQCVLADTAFVGGLCGVAECGQACISHLAMLCSIALSADNTAHSAAAAALGKGGSSSSGGTVVDSAAALTEALATDPSFVERHALGLLCRLLRCEREQARADVVESLRALAVQLHPPQVRLVAALVGEALLEGTVGRQAAEAAGEDEAALASFRLLAVEAPASLRLCTRASFRATLPGVLSFMTNELLTAAAALPQPGEVLLFLAERCLLPAAVSPGAVYFPTQALAVRSLAQCAAFVLRQRPEVCTPQTLRRVLDCCALALARFTYARARLVPPAADFTGARWLDAARLPELRDYAAAAADRLRALGTMTPAQIVGGRAPAASTAATATTAASPPAGEEAPERMMRDEQLVELCSLLVPLLGGVPKLVAALKAPAAGAAAGTTEQPSPQDGDAWAPPPASPVVLVELLLGAVGTAFAILWRIDHPADMAAAAAYEEVSAEVSAAAQSTALLPHSILRGALSGYVELAADTEAYTPDMLLEQSAELLRGIARVQAVAVEGAGGSQAPPPQQRVQSQEQQYVRTCYAGMYQELSLALAAAVRRLLDLRRHHPHVSPARAAAVEAVAADPRVFAGFTALLAPGGGAVIASAREYFTWYIAHTRTDTDTAAAAATVGEADAPAG